MLKILPRLSSFVGALAMFAALRAEADVVINEILYRPGTGYPENTNLEFIELLNTGAAPVDVSGWAFTNGIAYTFPAGSSIAAGGYAVVAANPTALRAAYGIATAFGPWDPQSSLSNKDEKIALSQPGPAPGTFVPVSDVHYASEGDWATRVRETTFNGWEWRTPANGGGKSMELRNATVSNDNGQNWAPSTAAAGATPGAVNSVATSNIAPIIHDVQHSPAVPKPADPVTISCQLTDETPTVALTATLFWRDATGIAPGPFQSVAMTAGAAGKFSATLGALPNLRIVEFYISASDGTNTRTWPAPTSEGQNANCQYQVSDEVFDPNDIYDLVILTGAENAAYESLAGSHPERDRQFNMTFVSVRGTEATVRYRSSMRIRGNSSRAYQFKPLRITFPLDDRWDGASDFNLNPRSSFAQYIGFRLFQAAGLRAEDALPVRPRRNGVADTTSGGSTPDYGRWVRVEELNGDMADHHWPTTQGGNVYKKGRPDQYWRNTGWTVPADPAESLDGWTKQNNSSANDWSDLTNFFAVAQQVTGPHFPGAPANNSAGADGSSLSGIGSWAGTPFTASEITTLNTVADLDQWARWFAVMTIIEDNETNISNGQDDDYAIYFVPGPAGQRRIDLIPHDLDTILGRGDSPVAFNDRGLYDMTDDGSVFRPLLPLLGNNSTAGNAGFRTKYYDAIRDLYGTVLNADTSTNPYPPFYAFLDNHLAGWVPTATITAMKTFATNRQGYLLGLIGSAATTPPAPTSLSGLSSAHGTLMISEILANNVAAVQNGTTFPDVIELSNSGATDLDVGGMSLTDDPTLPAKYVFPAGTIIAANGFLLIYADSDFAAPGLHAGFALDHDGDQLTLYNGATLIDTVAFGPQVPDLSISRTGAALDVWTLTTPTLGASNSPPVQLGSVGAVRINEILTNPDYLLSDDFAEIYNPGTRPVALGGVTVTDDFINYPARHALPPLSFIGAKGFLAFRAKGNLASPGNPTELSFKFSSVTTWVAIVGANGTLIDQLDTGPLPPDTSQGRSPDGAAGLAEFRLPTNIPSPGAANVPPPTEILALLNQLRVTELLYKPNNLEYIELQNVGGTALDISGVRFTAGVGYTFPAGTILAPGAFIVICKDRAAFLAQFGAGVPLAPDVFTGTLDNAGETLTLRPPLPWEINILSFAYSPMWYPETNNDRSLVVVDASSTLARDWDVPETWSFSSQLYGNPGAGFPPEITSQLVASAVTGDAFTYQITARHSASSYGASGLPGGLALDDQTGLISGVPTQLGVFNVNISATNAAGTDNQTLVLTVAETGPLTGFEWNVIADETSGIAFTGTLRAHDAAGRTVTSFNGSATISAQSVVPVPTVVFTEFGTTSPTPDYFEIQNVGSIAVDTSGWFVITNASSVGVNAPLAVAWPLPANLAPGQLTGATDSGSPAPTETAYGADIDWPNSPPPMGWAMLVDKTGTIRDFVAWGYTAANLATISFTHSGFPFTVGTQWNGNGAPTMPAGQSLFRSGATDTNRAADWSLGPTPSPRGTQNAGLILPWLPSFTALSAVPGGTVNLVNGVWTGPITVLDIAPVAELQAVVNGYPLVRSNTFAVNGSNTNTPPIFTKGPDQTIIGQFGTRTIPGWATGIRAGPSNESGQTVSFLVTTDNPGLFLSGPSIQSNGTLVFSPAVNANGIATVTVRAKDDGGTANGGIDTSEPQTFAIRFISMAVAQGKYRGLIQPPAGASPNNAQFGDGEFAVSATGRFTTKLSFGGHTYRVKGALDTLGVATFGRHGDGMPLPRKGLAPLLLSLRVDLLGATRRITGQIMDWPAVFAQFAAERDAYDAKLQPVPATLLNNATDDGNYTGIFQAQPAPNGGLNADQFPQGDGWTTLRVVSSGAVLLRGQFADGSPFAYASALDAFNHFPFYAPLYHAKGAVVGQLMFNTTSETRIGTSDLTWMRPAQGGPLYPGGWPAGIALGFDGAARNRLSEPNAFPLGNATLTLTGGNLAAGGFTKSILVGDKNHVTVPAPGADKTQITLRPTGQWLGHFVHPITGKSTSLEGVILRNRAQGAGFFLGTNESGHAAILPAP